MREYEEEGTYVEEEEQQEDVAEEEEQSDDDSSHTAASNASVQFKPLSRAQVLRRNEAARNKLKTAHSQVVKPDRQPTANEVRSALLSVDQIRVPELVATGSLYSNTGKNYPE